MFPRMILFSLFLSGVLYSCSQANPVEKLDLLSAEFQSFNLEIADNPILIYDVTGTFDGNTITLGYPDPTIPTTVLAPRFSTEAYSVELNGVEQESGVSIVDFNNEPIIYTLTSSSGLIQQFYVNLKLNASWHDLGIWGGADPISIRAGSRPDQDNAPYFVSLDSGNSLSAYAADPLDYTIWQVPGGAPGGFEAFDTSYWNGEIWTLARRSGINAFIDIYSCDPIANWTLQWTSPTASIGMAGSLSISGVSSRYLAFSWIDDTWDTKVPVIYVYDAVDLTWNQLSSSLVEDAYGAGTILHFESLQTVSDEGTTLYAAATFEEASGLIHLFKISNDESQWSPVRHDTTLPNWEYERKILAMYYDTEKQAPVLITKSRRGGFQNIYVIRTLYYSEIAGDWTDINYVDPLYISSDDVASLSVSWTDNMPSAVYGSTVLGWDGSQWIDVGLEHFSPSPLIQTLTRGKDDSFITMFNDGLTNLVVREYQ